VGKQLLKAAAVLALLALTAGQAEAGPVYAIYTFDDLAVGTTTPFSDTQGGVTAQFNGDASTTGVVTANSSFAPPFMGNILMSGGGHFGLFVTFSTPIHNVSVDVAGVNSNPGYSFFSLTAYSGGLGGTEVGEASIQLENPHFMPQGELVFSSHTPFDTIDIEPSPSYYLWIDNLAIDSAVVPEPAGLTLAAVCIGAMALGASRRRRSA
jgi:hypothetical protein